MASINLDLYLHVLTPVHVGGSEEKHLEAGIDYLIENHQVFIFDQKKLRNRINDDNQYCNALENGKGGMESLLNDRRIPVHEVSLPPKSVTGMPTEINACIKNGLTGKPYLPGSSIKGAIRSIIFNKIYTGLPQEDQRRIQKAQYPDNDILGKFGSSLMRFIQVSDVYFDDTETILCNTKIFNPQKSNPDIEWSGGWKHLLKNHTNDKFAPQGFTFAYESIPTGAAGKFRLSFDEALFNQAKNSRKLNIPSKIKNFFSNGFEQTIFDIIHQYSANYLINESTYFKHYSIAETEQICQSYNNVISNNQITTPVFRTGSGSGFHSITGDWHYPKNHVIDDVWGSPYEQAYDSNMDNPDFDKDYVKFKIPFKNRKKMEGGLKWKSRRLCFEGIGKNRYLFQPMGFVQLVTSTYYQNELKDQIAANKKEALAIKEKVLQEIKAKEEAARIAEEEAKKPKLRSLETVKKEKQIDGEVIGQQGIQLFIKPFVEGFEDHKLPIRYPAGLPTGTIVIVSATVIKDKIQLSHPMKKK